MNTYEKIYELHNERTITLDLPDDFQAEVVKVIVLPLEQPKPDKKNRVSMREMYTKLEQIYEDESEKDFEFVERSDRPNPFISDEIL